MIEGVYERRSRCRACDQETLEVFLSLGPQPLANALPLSPNDREGEAKYPLDVAFCTTCGLVQIPDVIRPEVLFGDYVYVTGVSSTIAEHNRRYAATVVERLGLGAQDLVVEVASNDGSLLRCFQAEGVDVLGVEPASNIAAMAREAGVPTEDVFFDAELAAELRDRHGPAAAIIGNNVLAHVDRTADFLSGMAAMLRPDGLAITEVPYLRDFVERLEYDTVYHEHHCYFGVTPLLRLAERAGLRVVDVEEVPVHGGSIRVFYAPEATHPEHGARALEMAEAERRDGLLDVERYRQFAKDVEAQRDALLGLLADLQGEGSTVAGYGAPAKGHTLLNYCGIGPDVLPFTVDRNPLKVGKYTPGTRIPILPVEAIAERRPDYLLILPWNFAEEIMEQQSEFRESGGRFILPIPEPRILE